MMDDSKMYSLTEAANAVGLSRQALHKAIKNGKVSAQKDEHGHLVIQPAELHRVYKPVNKSINQVSTDLQIHESPEITLLRAEFEYLKAKSDETINDLRRRLDKAEDERRSAQEKLSLLLEYKPLETVEQKIEKKGENQLWKKVFKNDKSIK
jgi:predicted DNA-binding protein YlxM (UPF0122 family)